MDQRLYTQQSNGAVAGGSIAYLPLAVFLCLVHLPGRLCAWQAAALLGMEEQHIPILIKARLLKPLGNPPANSAKFFARDYILALGCDDKWLTKASDALVAHWARRNAKKGTN